MITQRIFGRIAMTVLLAASVTGIATAQEEKPAGVPQPKIVTREDWGSKPDPIPDSRKQTPRVLTIHHEGDKPWTETSNPWVKIVNLQVYGKNEKDWPDLPYHYIIAPNGMIFEGRDVQYQPETNTKYNLDGHVGIMLYGNFEEQRVSPKQLEAVTKLSAWLCDKYKIDPMTIDTHKDSAPGQTDCPGRDFYRYVHEGPFKDWVKDVMAGKTPEYKELAALPEGPTAPIPMGINEKPAPEAAEPKATETKAPETTDSPEVKK